MGTSLRRTLSLLLALAFVGAPVMARSKGTARVEHSDGVVREYDVSVQVVDHQAVRITSADGRGTLVIGKAACSYLGDLERCLPYRIVLEEPGQTHQIDFERGTVYLNLTDTARQLPLSTNHVPPHSLLLFVVTAHGTHITVRGTIDRITG